MLNYIHCGLLVVNFIVVDEFWSTMHIEARRVRFVLTLFLNVLVNMYVEAPDVTFTVVGLSTILNGLTTFL